MTKKISSANEMFDFLSTLTTNVNVTVCHMNVVKLKKTTSVLNPQTNRLNKAVDYAGLGKLIGSNSLAAIISLTKYSGLKWQNHDQFANDYNRYVQQSNSIRNSFGLKPMGHKKKNIERISFGNDKLTLGNNSNQGKSYIEQNTFDCDKEVYYYGVDDKGNIIGEFSDSQIYKYLDNDRNISGIKELKKLTTNNNVIDYYIDKIIKLKMEYTQFLNDRIIYMIGESGGQKCYFVNDKPTNIIDNINVNIDDIMDYVRVNFYHDLKMMTENKKKYSKMAIKENQRRDNLLAKHGLGQEDYENFNIYPVHKLRDKYGDKFEDYHNRMSNFNSDYNKKIRESKKQIIKLTEADLHRVIKESVKRILKEVTVGGEELHGTNPSDWFAMANVRAKRNVDFDDVNKASRNERLGYDAVDDKYRKIWDAEQLRHNPNYKRDWRDKHFEYLKGKDLLSREAEMETAPYDGEEKSDRIIDNLGW